jgi:hypothetical protein
VATEKYWPKSEPSHSWPAGIPNELTLSAFVQLFRSLGYEECPDGLPEAGTQKVAIYTRGGQPTHAAILQPNGRWSSKWGNIGADIWHATVEVLEGPDYGTVGVYMRRPKP